MYFINVWDGINNTTYTIKANTLCEARTKAMTIHKLTNKCDWCEVSQVSHRIF